MSVSIMITSSNDLEKINLTLKILNFIKALIEEPTSAGDPEFELSDLTDLSSYYSAIQTVLKSGGMTLEELEDYQQSLASS